MLFVGDDWAEDHHDVEIVDDDGRVLARRRLPEGLDGITRLHALIAEHLPTEWADWEPAQAAAMVTVGIETDRGPWVAALVATGYEVFAINPMSVARYRERHSTSGAKSDTADAHLLAEIVRLDRAHHRPVAGDSDSGEAIKLTARTIRAWSGTAPATCCACGRRCGSSSRPRSPPSRISTPPTRSSCSGGHRTRTRQRV
jgi:transposase